MGVMEVPMFQPIVVPVIQFTFLVPANYIARFTQVLGHEHRRRIGYEV